MPDKVRIHLAQARVLAGEVIALFDGICEKIEVAGSIRRGKPDIGDAEICLIPKFETRPVGLFQEETERVNLQLVRTAELIEAGTFTKRIHSNGASTCGAGAQYLSYKDSNIDLFGVIDPSQWGVIFCIRTGPDSFNRRKLVLTRSCGGILQTAQRIHEGQLWDMGRALITPDEEALFKQIGHEFIRPEDRADFAERSTYLRP